MSVVAIFGITNDALNLVVNLLILFLVVIWLALVWWTYADAKRRIDDPMLVGTATVASLFPFVGTIVYVIVRPPEYLDDVRERQLEIAAAEAKVDRLRDRGLDGVGRVREAEAVFQQHRGRGLADDAAVAAETRALRPPAFHGG